MTTLYLRNTHPTRPCLVPVGNGSARLLLPAVTSCLPAGVVQLPAVRRMLAAQVLAVVDVTGWDAEARQRQVDRLGMEALIRNAEQREFDQWRQREAPRRIHRPPNRNRKRRADEWPQAQIERLRRCWTEGVGAEQIAAELGRGTGAVLAKALRLGLPARPPRNAWPAERVARLRQRWADGASSRVLAAELGVTPMAVVSKARDLGLPARPRSLWLESQRRGGQRASATRWATLQGPAFAPQPRQDGAEALACGAITP